MKNIFFKIFAVLILLAITSVGGYFSYDYYQKTSVSEINNISLKKVKNLEDCKILFTSDFSQLSKNKYFKATDFTSAQNLCKKAYDLEQIDITDGNNCYEFIQETNSYFEKNFRFLENLEEKRKTCIAKKMKVSLSNGEFFNIYNDFKSRIIIDDSSDFYNKFRTLSRGAEDYEKYEKEAKNLLKKIVKISPEVKIQDENITFASNNIFIDLDLQPKTKYSFSVFGTENNKEKVLAKLDFETPEKKYFGLKVVNPVTLYSEKNLPKFEVLDFNSGKKSTNIKICKLSEQDYAKFEVYRKTKEKNLAKKYFYENIEKYSENCTNKDLQIETKENILTKKSFEFDEYLQDKNGLFFISFSNKDDIEFNTKINYPVFFGKVNSNILMKISKNGDGFFFVNDLETGLGLENQEIFVYQNDFDEFDTEWRDNENIKKYKLEENKNVFEKPISLGKTDKNGVLEVNLKEKLGENVFYKTYQGNDELEGQYESFFVKSLGEKHVSYLTSTWNGGIEPWNFGYDLDWKNSMENFRIGYISEDDINSHTFTDRVLYLPGEKVYIKGIFRKAKDLGIPFGEKFDLKVHGPTDKVYEKEIEVNEFGSVTESFDLKENAENGYYNVSISNKKGVQIGQTSFSVETFKKPKIKTNISLETSGLKGDFVKITETKDSDEYYGQKEYFGKFSIKANISSRYYNGATLSGKDFTYKVFRQEYFGDDFWDDCFFGCFYEPTKEFYTEGNGTLTEFGTANFDINVDFSSNYTDYKYIVEVSVKDDSGEEITSSNSILAKLPESLKSYNPYLSLHFESDSRMIKTGEKIKIKGGLNKGKRLEEYNGNYIFVVKRKEYTNKKVTDTNGFERNISSQKEVLENIFFVNDKNFSLTSDEKLELNHKVLKTGEYVFYYGALNKEGIAKYLKIENPNSLSNSQIQEVFEKFEKNQDAVLEYDEKYASCIDYDEKSSKCMLEAEKTSTNTLDLEKLFSGNRNYFSVVSFSENKNIDTSIKDDNKLTVISDKVVYKIGETAKIFVKLPVSKSKILITREVENVKNYEIVNVNSNIFFKEFVVDESFSPNTYISIYMIDLESKIPEYKVGYGEIVIDKTDKKADIGLKTDKEVYSPREKVKLQLETKNSAGKPIKSEIAVAVIDDSLISLMGNINPNTLEFIFKKFPFITQTSMSNIAMIRNYYFSRKGQVGGSGFSDLKGGDSAVSTRNIFKNTAYFGNIITDENGKAELNFELPDNLTSFRIIAISNSKDNYFGFAEKNIEVKKSVVLEDKTPFILRDGDRSEIGALVTNNSSKDRDFKILLDIENLEAKEKDKKIHLKSGETKYVSFEIIAPEITEKNIKYSLSAIGESSDFSDKIEKTLQIKTSPIIVTNHETFLTLTEKNPIDAFIKIPENIDLYKTKVQISFANNKIAGIENLIKNLENDIYFDGADDFIGKISKNIILKKYSKFSKNYDEKMLNSQIQSDLKNLSAFQNTDGGFAYYKGWKSNYYITKLALETYLELKNMGETIPEASIEKALSYLENIFKSEKNQNIQAEIYAILHSFGKNIEKTFDTNTLNRKAYLAYVKTLLKDKEKNKSEIYKEIDFLIQSFSEKIDKKDFYLYDNQLEKSIFISLLYDLDALKYKEITEKYVSEIYEQDWTNGYYSYETRNKALKSLMKYLEKNYKNNSASFGFSLGNYSEKDFRNLNVENTNIKLDFVLKDIIKDGKLHFKTVSNSQNPVYINISLIQYPKDKTLIREIFNKYSIKREFFEITDENKIIDCQNDFSSKACQKIYKKIDGNILEKGKTYRAKISIISENPDIRNQIILQNFLPAGISVLNSKFYSISTNFRNDTNWDWYNVQKNPNLIQAVTYSAKDTLEFEYFFKTDFSGKFANPPAIIKELYNPFKNANTSFLELSIK